MRIIDLINGLPLGTELTIINCNGNLLFQGYSENLKRSENDFPKTLESNIVKILEIKDNKLEILSDYLF